MSDTKNQACQWKYCEHECSWDTQCDNKYQFTNDGPKENGYKFCPGCGKPVALAGDREPATIETAETKHVCISDLLAAETTLKALHDQMAAECQAGMDKWPRDWMQNHVNERAAIIKVRNILISRAEAANAPDEPHAKSL